MPNTARLLIEEAGQDGSVLILVQITDAINGALSLLRSQDVLGGQAEHILELISSEHVVGMAGMRKGALGVLRAIIHVDRHELLGMLASDQVLDKAALG